MQGVSLKDVLEEMSSGIAFSEDYGNSDSDINQLGRTMALGGSVMKRDEFIERCPGESAPLR